MPVRVRAAAAGVGPIQVLSLQFNAPEHSDSVGEDQTQAVTTCTISGLLVLPHKSTLHRLMSSLSVKEGLEAGTVK